MRLKSNTTAKRSVFTRAAQTITRPGTHWQIDAQWSNLWEGSRADLVGFFARLNGREHRVSLPVFNYTTVSRRGTYQGSPVVDGASQTGATLDIRGATATVTDWARAGDYIQVGNQLFMVTADTDTNGAGEASLPIIPKIRSSFIDGLAVEVTPASLLVTCIMVTDLEEVVTGSAGAGVNFADLSLSFVEDIIA